MSWEQSPKAYIYRDPIIAWIIVRQKRKHGYWGLKSDEMFVIPITASWDNPGGVDDDLSGVFVKHKYLDTDMGFEIVSVIPSWPQTYRIICCPEEGECEPIGTEFPGASHPDWHKECAELLRYRENMEKPVNNKK